MKFRKKNVIDIAYEDYVFSDKKILDDVKIYRIQNETGTGEMRTYNLFEGIQLSYNNLNMDTVYQKIEPKKGILQIDHCLEGCYELKLNSDEYVFLGKGDLIIGDLGRASFENSRIPMKTYRGLSIYIDMNLAQKTIDRSFPFLDIDIIKIRDRFCRKRAFSIINYKNDINNIVNDLYKPDDRIETPYIIIKVLELLLSLRVVETKDINKIPSFSKPVYDATKECYKDMVANPFKRYSISELAKKYAVSESSLKRCFSYITGNSIGDFKRNLLLEASAKMLVDDFELSVKEISDIAGYVNQSKFSAAFKSYFGLTPTQYRSKFI